jgi:hypothetical protein
MAALLYFGLKFLAYTLWCYFGLVKFRHELQPAWPRVVAYGFLRLFMGLFPRCADLAVEHYFDDQAGIRTLAERFNLPARLRSGALD